MVIDADFNEIFHQFNEIIGGNYGKSPFFRLKFSEKVPFLDEILWKKSLFVAGMN